MILALLLVVKTLPLHLYPVSWTDAPAPFTQAQALGICQQASLDWANLTNGQINITCQAEPIHVFSTPFPGPCEDGNAYGLPVRDSWIILYAPPNCRFYQTNLGRPGGWWQVIGGTITDHEIGHTLGLNHTCEQYGWRLGGFQTDPATCCGEYAEVYDLMGHGEGLNSWHRQSLGLPTPNLITTASAGGFYFLMDGPVPNQNNQDSVAITYAGGQQTAGCDVTFAAFLLPGETWTWSQGGISVLATSARTVSITRITPAPSSTPTSTPAITSNTTPTPGACWFGITQVSCTPTRSATAGPTGGATWTPTPSPSAPSWTATQTVPTFTPSSTTPAISPSATPDANRHPGTVSPRALVTSSATPSPPSTPAPSAPSRGCGGGMGILVGTALAALVVAGRR